jgi:hypothetical protein
MHPGTSLSVQGALPKVFFELVFSRWNAGVNPCHGFCIILNYNYTMPTEFAQLIPDGKTVTSCSSIANGTDVNAVLTACATRNDIRISDGR